MAMKEVQHLLVVGAPGAQNGLCVKAARFLGLRCGFGQHLSCRCVQQNKAGLRVKVAPEVEQPGAAVVGPAPYGLVPVRQKDFAGGKLPRFSGLNRAPRFALA